MLVEALGSDRHQRLVELLEEMRPIINELERGRTARTGGSG